MDGFCLNAASGCGVYWWMESSPTQSAPDTVSANLRMILRGILAALGMWRVQPVLARVLYNRISAILRRIERLLVRFRAGLLRPWAPRTAASGPRAARKPPILMPRKFGWLLAAGCGCCHQLRSEGG